MFEAAKSPYRVPYNGKFRLSKCPTEPPKDAPGKSEAKTRLEVLTAELDDLQRMLYAEDRYSVLMVFQAMDAAGKDSTIRAVMSGINPAGCQVFSFKQPCAEELDHDFLWRTARRLPERGRIGIFNRSYYEEVLVVRVHPEYLAGQRLPPLPKDMGDFWEGRLASIREHEEHLARTGMVILKFWLNVSRDEQRKRFLARIDKPHKNWKFSSADLRERAYWDDYMKAYQEALAATSRPWAPWYAIPADDKPFMQLQVAEILAASLKRLGLAYPKVDKAVKARFGEMREMLENES